MFDIKVFLVGIFFFILLNGIWNFHDKISDKLGKNLFWYVVAFGAFACLFMAFYIPFSPSNDSFDMLNSLDYLLHGYGLTDYSRPYYSFYATNKLALIIYFGFAKIFGSLVFGIKIFHFFASFFTIFFISMGLGKVFGERYQAKAFIGLLMIYPYIILVGPYIYPVSILFAAMAFYFCLSEDIFGKFIFLMTFGFLYSVRPTASIFVFAFFLIKIVWSFYNKDDRRKKFITIGTLLFLPIFCILYQNALGFVMYKTGAHTYPGFENSAGVWTLDLGTRYQGESTGTCTYSAMKGMEGDPIADKMTRLWVYYSEDDPEDYEEIKALNKEVRKDITERSLETYDNFHDFALFIKYKTINSLRNTEKPYLYTLNYNSPTFEKQLYHDINEDGFLYFNTLYVTSAMCFIAFMAICIGEFKSKRKIRFEYFFILSMAIGIIINFSVFVLLTEVSKRYFLDMYLPVSSIIIGLAILVSSKIKLGNVSWAGLCMVSTIALTACFYVNNNQAFKNVQVEVVNNVETGVSQIHWLFEEEPPEGYNFILPDQDLVPITKDCTLEIPIRTNFVIDTGEQRLNVVGNRLKEMGEE